MFFESAVFAKLVQILFSGCMALFFMIVGFKLLSGTLAIDIAHELQEKNAAVGLAVMGMLVCVGLAVGLTVGLLSLR